MQSQDRLTKADIERMVEMDKRQQARRGAKLFFICHTSEVPLWKEIFGPSVKVYSYAEKEKAMSALKKLKKKLYEKLAKKLPRRLALQCFLRVATEGCKAFPAKDTVGDVLKRWENDK